MTFEDLYDAWKSGSITQAAAARLLGVSERTFRRHARRFEKDGAEGLIDRRVSLGSARRAPPDEIADVVDAYKNQHEGWNVRQFYARYRRAGGRRSYNWVRMRLLDAGAVKKLPGRGLHRSRLERAPLPGLRLHQDSCRHEWLAGRRCDLVVTLDDATGEHHSMLICDRHGTLSSLAGVRDVLERKGFFCSLYTDRASRYRYGRAAGAAEKPGPGKPGQVERAMNQLGIKLTVTRAAQVRARCARAFQTHIDRLPTQLSAAGVADIDAANRYLEDHYRRAHNRAFRQVPHRDGSGFEPCANREQLDDILCEQHSRVVRKDNRVSFEGRLLRLPSRHPRRGLAGTRVMVRRHLDRTLSISHGIRRLAKYDADGGLIDRPRSARCGSRAPAPPARGC